MAGYVRLLLTLQHKEVQSMCNLVASEICHYN